MGSADLSFNPTASDHPADDGRHISRVGPLGDPRDIPRHSPYLLSMSDRATAMNPDVLKWARERMGLSISEAAAYVGRPTEIVAAWEEGSAAPTYRQLETLANAFKRPVALFFFPDPPEEPEPSREFRTLPESAFEDFEPDTYLALREGHAWQQSVRELAGGRNPADRQIVREVSVSTDRSIAELAVHVREYLGVSLADQQRWLNPTIAFKEWRRVVESVGIFVFKRSFDQRTISGFCLHDDEFPVIVVNNSTAHSRQIFTLFHELAHLLFHVSGITREQGSSLADLSRFERDIEVTCNRFAAEFLVPDESFPWSSFRGRDTSTLVVEVAQRFNVSREVILRKLLNRGLVDNPTYTRLTESWNREYEESRGRNAPGGNYYATQAAYFGDNYLRLAFGQYRSGRVSLPELADHLGMKARNIGKLEDFFLSRK